MCNTTALRDNPTRITSSQLSREKFSYLVALGALSRLDYQPLFGAKTQKKATCEIIECDVNKYKASCGEYNLCCCLE